MSKHPHTINPSCSGGDATTATVVVSPHWSVPVTKPKTGFSPAVAFCFTVNYVVGTGFLTIPWAFVQGGIALSTALLILSAIASDVAKDYILDAMARAENMLDADMHWIDLSNSDKEQQQSNDPECGQQQLLIAPQAIPIATETTLLLSTEKGKEHDSAEGDGTAAMKHITSELSLPGTAVVTPLSSEPGTPNIGRYQRRQHHHHQDGGVPGIVRNRLVVRPSSTSRSSSQLLYVVKDRKFEVNALCRVFLGWTGVKVFTLFICLYMYGLLWAYTSVFASAMARAAPVFGHGNDDVDHQGSVESWNYLCYAIFFALVVVPMTCLELEEQVTIQVTLTLCRFVLLFLMLATSYSCAAAAGAPGDDAAGADASSPPAAMLDDETRAPMFRPEGLHKMLPILVVANMFHHSIPGLSHPVVDKRKLAHIFRATTIFTTAAYAMIGIILGTAFGWRIEQSSNLNWKDFHRRHHPDISSGQAVAGAIPLGNKGSDAGGDHIFVEKSAWWEAAISWYIICFPALDVISAFPLNAITLANSVFGAVYGRRIHEVENDRLLRTGFRLLASIPPIVLGILVRELGIITDYAGTTGFVIGFTIPALLYVRSKKMARDKNYSTLTHYTSYGSIDSVAWILCWFGVIMVAVVFVSLTFFGN